MSLHLDTGSVQSDDDVMTEINTTPLIDIMLVLLIMLIITIPTQTHSVNLDMPRPDTPPPAEPKVINVVVQPDGSILWDGEPIADRAALERDIVAAAAQDPQPELHLAPDRGTRYSNVAMVLAEAQRLGLNKIGIVATAPPPP